MKPPMLLLDIGNSRLKWATARATEIDETGTIAHVGDPAAAITALPVAQANAIWVAHVTGAVHEEQLGATLHQRYGYRPNYARAATHWRELRNAYAEPERLGVDRWLVMIAAWAKHRGAACIVDAGTALTIDNIDAVGQHLGGIIAAGLDTQQRAVLGHTRFATRDMAAAYDGGLGMNTEACVRQGAMLACLGAIDRGAQLAGPGAQLWLTGGDAGHLLPHLGGSWQHRPNLVLEGLLQLAREA
ncbi:MAG: type III pantothenate kinase [Pseudomonadota bacterium]|nr:type III pantothenate kinase [Pseudomonadota bacterium]